MAQRIKWEARDLDCDDLCASTLRSLEANDPDVDGILIEDSNWITRAGPAIRNSTSLRRLQIYIPSECGPEYIWLSELLRDLIHNRSIESFGIYFDKPHSHYQSFPWDIFDMLIPFIVNNSNLQHIELQGGSLSVLSFLAVGLTSCKTKGLKVIELLDIDIGGDFGTFFAALTGYHDLSEILVYDSIIGLEGCIALSKLLQHPESHIRSIDFQNTPLDDDFISSICIGLTRNQSVKSINLRGDCNVSSTGWKIFSDLLSNPMCSIEYLGINFGFRDSVPKCIEDALSVNKSLKYLNLKGNKQFTFEGWGNFSGSLRNPCFSLAGLNLSLCNFDDEGVIMLMHAMEGNASLKHLHLDDNKISSRGLVAIFNHLRNFESSLKTLHVVDNNINFGELTSEDWSVLSRALCDKTSIERIFSSNHNLYMIAFFEDDELEDEWKDVAEWDNIVASLEMNKQSNRAVVAREKILTHHFAGGTTDMSVFARMPESILPFAMEWIGRNSLGYSLMYQFVGGFPLLFNDQNCLTDTGIAKKRKYTM